MITKMLPMTERNDVDKTKPNPALACINLCMNCSLMFMAGDRLVSLDAAIDCEWTHVPHCATES